MHIGRVPAYSVVVPGTLPGKPLADGSPGPSLSCAVIIKQVDEKIAATATQLVRPLTQKFVEDHLKDVGLEAEFATHTRMGALSGGQKVKVVLASAMWMEPHVLILDEPTNFLDRDSLGALAVAMAFAFVVVNALDVARPYADEDDD